MKQIKIGNSELIAPAIGVGCMRLLDLNLAETDKFVKESMEMGLNFFEHADIYGGNQCETQFGTVLEKNSSLRDKMMIQSKCGIVPGKMFDFSREHIIRSTEGILKRLQTDYLDLLVLHRPDALVEPEEVAEAFDYLQGKGMVRNFGVSNHKPMQIELLKKTVRQPLLVNQLQFSIPASTMISAGLEANMPTPGAVDRDGEVLDYCRLHDVTIQAWSPFQIPGWKGVFIGSEEYSELNTKLDELAEKYGVSNTAIATAWILRHPANIQVISGTMKTTRLQEMASACDVNLTREEWYGVYMAAGNILP